MKCSNCGKKINPKKSFCSNCGTEIVVPEKIEKPKSKVQVFKIIMIVFTVGLAAMSYFITKTIYTYDTFQEFFDAAWAMPAFKTISVLTLFVPIIFLALFYAMAWMVPIIINIVGIVSASLTMIHATKIKKFILIVIIIAFIALTIYTIINIPEK